MLKTLILALLATSLSVNSAENIKEEEGRLRRLQSFLQNGFSLDEIVGDDGQLKSGVYKIAANTPIIISQLKSEMTRRLLSFRSKEAGLEGLRQNNRVDPEVGLNAEGIVRR